MKKEIKPRELTLVQFGFKPCSYRVFGKFSHGINKGSSGRYSIRIDKGSSTNFLSGQTTQSWDYFELDKDGLIISSPRGMAKYYNKKVRIIDIEERFKEQKEPS